MLIQTVSTMWLVAALAAPDATQTPAYRAAKARRHFISVSFERQFVQPYGFGKHPLAELLGQPVDEVQLEHFQYRTRDQLTTVNVLEYGKRATAIGATVYPFGSSVGATLAIRGSIDSVPRTLIGIMWTLWVTGVVKRLMVYLNETSTPNGPDMTPPPPSTK